MSIRLPIKASHHAAIAATVLITTTAFAAEHHDSPHHASLFLGQTEVLEDGHSNLSGFTVGVDYEYRVNPFLGIGFVAEHATGDVDANTLIAAFDLHFGEGWVVQTGPGYERIDGESNYLGRLGVLYEFEVRGFTLSPQLHYDMTNKEDSVVFGIAFGSSF